MLKRSGKSVFGIWACGVSVVTSAARGERAAAFAVFAVEVCARLPELREEFFVERGLEVADAFAPARALLRAEHALDHLDVVVAPEREELVVRDERFRQLILFEARLEVRDDFERGPHAQAVRAPPLLFRERRVVGRRVQAPARKERVELLAERGRLRARAQTFGRELVVAEGAPHGLVF